MAEDDGKWQHDSRMRRAMQRRRLAKLLTALLITVGVVLALLCCR